MPVPEIFSTFDFQQLDHPDFKEDSVREVLILPFLHALGYNHQSIVRSKSLEHPFLKIGSKKRKIQLVPDYLLRVGDNFAWVLDAKASNEDIRTGDHIEQVYSYSIHPEVRSRYFALCNGREFTLFRQDQDTPILDLTLADLPEHWKTLTDLLAPDAFQGGKTFSYQSVRRAAPTRTFDYLNRPLLEEIPVKKQSAKRHFGVHGYFTKQTWNVVQEYIRNFSQKGDVVLDPFGGSGITAVEALMIGRKGIHVDLNPLSVFLTDALARPIDTKAFSKAYQKLETKLKEGLPETEEEIRKALKKYPYPTNWGLAKGSDVESVEELFSDEQLAQMGYLKHLIMQEKDENIRHTFLLMFSSLLTKTNLTYHTSKSRPRPGQGDTSAFRYYRYRIAPNYTKIDVPYYFSLRYKKLFNAKKEIASAINVQTIKNLAIRKGDATNLDFLKDQSVDYIYTDPPYGKKIPYLDLSVMWNAWLDLEVTEADYQAEAIEGGTLQKSKDDYNGLIAKSIQEMYRVLKFDRWMSFVFAHKDPEFWHLIIDSAERAGFEYAGAVKQKNGQTSFKKRQNPFTVLSGQLIINFRKVRKPKAILKANLGMNIGEVILQTIEGVIAKNGGAALEEINDELIIKGLEMGFLDLLKKEYSDLTPLMQDMFDYDEETEQFSIRENAKFKTHIDVKLRIRYYLISYLRRCELEGKYPTFDEITLHIIPLLRNGTTPENQTILSVLEDIAMHTGDDRWQLMDDVQLNLFKK